MITILSAPYSVTTPDGTQIKLSLERKISKPPQSSPRQKAPLRS